MNIGDVCQEVKNFFVRGEDDIHSGTFTIENGHIQELPFLQNGQYFRITGSVFNDGVWKYSSELALQDETFDGTVWAMSVPPAFIALAGEISEWETKNAETVYSPFQSESFGGYSYSKASGGSGSGGANWQSVFAARLNKWRKLSAL